MSSCGTSPDAPEVNPVIHETIVEDRADDFEPVNFDQAVDVVGLRSGMKVRDPQDPDPSHIFVVP